MASPLAMPSLPANGNIQSVSTVRKETVPGEATGPVERAGP